MPASSLPNAYVLDTGPLGLPAHDRPAQRLPIQQWLIREMSNGATIYLSEVADYEVRREVIRLIDAGQLPASRLARLARLDQLGTLFTWLPVSTAIWKRAAQLWADSRRQGKPTADAAALDADVLIAAQALEQKATVVTSNPTHLQHLVAIRSWP